MGLFYNVLEMRTGGIDTSTFLYPDGTPCSVLHFFEEPITNKTSTLTFEQIAHEVLQSGHKAIMIYSEGDPIRSGVFDFVSRFKTHRFKICIKSQYNLCSCTDAEYIIVDTGCGIGKVYKMDVRESKNPNIKKFKYIPCSVNGIFKKKVVRLYMITKSYNLVKLLMWWYRTIA